MRVVVRGGVVVRGRVIFIIILAFEVLEVFALFVSEGINKLIVFVLEPFVDFFPRVLGVVVVVRVVVVVLVVLDVATGK